MDDISQLLKSVLAFSGMSESSLGQAYHNAIENTNLNTIFMLVVTLYLSLKLVGMAYRTVMGLLWWGVFLGAGLLIFWISQRGIDEVVRVMWGFAMSWWGRAEKVVDDSPVYRMGKQFLDQHTANLHSTGARF